MSAVIWKFPLDASDYQSVTVPKGATFLSARYQHGQICLWALVDDTEPQEESRDIFIVGTGHPVPALAAAVFIDTVLVMDGAIVFHVFEDRRP